MGLDCSPELATIRTVYANLNSGMGQDASALQLLLNAPSIYLDLTAVSLSAWKLIKDFTILGLQLQPVSSDLSHQLPGADNDCAWHCKIRSCGLWWGYSFDGARLRTLFTTLTAWNSSACLAS